MKPSNPCPVPFWKHLSDIDSMSVFELISKSNLQRKTVNEPTSIPIQPLEKVDQSWHGNPCHWCQEARWKIDNNDQRKCYKSRTKMVSNQLDKMCGIRHGFVQRLKIHLLAWVKNSGSFLSSTSSSPSNLFGNFKISVFSLFTALQWAYTASSDACLQILSSENTTHFTNRWHK